MLDKILKKNLMNKSRPRLFFPMGFTIKTCIRTIAHFSFFLFIMMIMGLLILFIGERNPAFTLLTCQGLVKWAMGSLILAGLLYGCSCLLPSKNQSDKKGDKHE